MKKLEADVVVIGGGASGITAATSAAQHDASVIVLEKGSTTGGAASMGMGFFAVDSKQQRAQLINYNVEDMFYDFMKFTHWRVNARLVKKYMDQSASTVEWMESLGVEFLGAYKYFADSYQTWHIVKTPGSNKPAERCASIMYKAVTDEAKNLGTDIRFNTYATSLKKGDKGQIIGVMAEDADGETYDIDCSAVICATGGFGDDPDMIREKIGLTWGKDLYSFRIPGLKGDGLRMCKEAGALIDSSMIEVTYTTPGLSDVYKTLSETMRQPNLMVNLDGKRMINEDIMNNTNFTGNAIAIQRNKTAFTILTDSVLDEYRKQGDLDYVTVHHNIKTVDNWDKEIKAYFSGESSDTAGLAELQVSDQKFFFVGDSLEDIANQAGIDCEELKKTVEEYNKMAGQYDYGFGKDPRHMRELKEGGKWYCAQHFICGYGTLGGAHVDDELRVVNEDMSPIPGLYGCGTDVCSIFGDSYNFFMPGMTMGFAVNSGRMAGNNAMAYIDGDDFVE